jgi:copper chaperone
MKRHLLHVPDISCEHCQRSIEGDLSALPGVVRVAVAVPEKTVEVEFDDARTDLSAIVQAIEALGYDVPAT